MSLGTGHILGGIAVGIGATLVTDSWSLLLKHAFGVPSLNYCLLGRWVCHLPEGRPVHASISAASAKPLECAVGWMTHYTIGVVLALALVVLTEGEWLAGPTLLPALVYGVATVVFPFFTAAVARPRRCVIPDAASGPGEAQEPGHAYGVRCRAVRLRDRGTLARRVGVTAGRREWRGRPGRR